MKPKILYFIDHIYKTETLTQNCWIHNKDFLSTIYDILFIIRTKKPTYTFNRAQFTITAFNEYVSYETIKSEIKKFNPDIIEIFGPLFLGNAVKLVDDFYGKCKIIQHYAGSVPEAYWNPKIDFVIIDKTHFPAFNHIPIDNLILKNPCCDLSFFKPVNDTFKLWDLICSGGWYANKSQINLIRILGDLQYRLLLLGVQTDNNNQYTYEFLNAHNFYKSKKFNLEVEFKDHVHNVDMPLIYNSCKIFVWGQTENIENPITLNNRSVVEAVACGLPIIGFKTVFEKNNFIINSENAILVDTDKQFIDAVIELLNNKELLTNMSFKSREIAEQNLDFKIWHDQIHIDLYTKVLQK